MKIAAVHSHLNGLEHLQVHKRLTWQDIEAVLARVTAHDAKSVSQIRKKLSRAFAKAGWKDEKNRAWKIPYYTRDRVALEVQFSGYSLGAYDLFVKHLAFYVGDFIDVGVEIVPMKSLSASTVRASGKRVRKMSTGVPWYEKELYNLIREGRGVPGVPLVIVGVEA